MSAIQDRYRYLRTNVVDLGEPLGGEEPLGDGGARQRFEHGNIYFHPRVGRAFECYGLILETYIEQQEALGPLGYPTTGEVDSPTTPGGRVNLFENGRLEWEQATGVTLVPTHGERLVLRKGDTGGEVAVLQRALARAGFDGGAADGIFGDRTRAAVTSLQAAAGLSADGIAGERTWVALRDRGALSPAGPELPYAPGVVCVEFARDAQIAFETIGGAVQAVSDTQNASELNAILGSLPDLEVAPFSDLAADAVAAVDELVEAAGEDIPRLSDTYKLAFSPDLDAAAVAEGLNALSFVASAAPSYFGVTTAQGDQFLGTSDRIDLSMPGGSFNQWYAYRCGADRAWKLSSGANTVVAVIDSGFLLDPSNASRRHDEIFPHADMSRARNLAAGGNDVSNSGDIEHGTATMGIAGAVAGATNVRGMRGFAPDAALWPFAIQGPGDATPELPLIERAIDEIIAVGDPRRVVISMSLALPISPGFTLHLEAIPYVASAIRRALAAGIVVVIGAGNEGNLIDLHSTVPPNPPAPVPNTGCIVVGGTGPRPDNPRWNSALGGASNHGARVDVCAPAEQLVAPGARPDTYITFRGTSGATPMVAGTAALMLSINPALTPAEVRSILTAAGPGAGTTSTERIGTFLDAGAAARAAFDRLVTRFGQDGWRWCNKCHILFFQRTGGSPSCPQGGSHDASGSGSYVMVQGVTPGWAQADWRWCRRCEALFFAAAASVCPHGGPHDGSTSGHYSLPVWAPPDVGQTGWVVCRACGCVVFSAGAGRRCYGGTTHDTAASGPYSVIHR